MANILVISHGSLAQELCISVSLIMGNEPCLSSISMDMTAGVEQLKKDLCQRITDLSKTGEQLIIVCDLYFGCPFISAVECAKALLPPQNYKIVTGANLPMLLELCIANKNDPDDLGNLVDVAVRMGKAGIQEFILSEEEYSGAEDL